MRRRNPRLQLFGEVAGFSLTAKAHFVSAHTDLPMATFERCQRADLNFHDASGMKSGKFGER
jgi:hypothetical protein